MQLIHQTDQNDILKVVRGDTFTRSLMIEWETTQGAYVYEIQSTDTVTLKIFDNNKVEILSQQCVATDGNILVEIPKTVQCGIYDYKLILEQESGDVYTMVSSTIYIRKE